MEIDWSKAPEGATHYLPVVSDCDWFACWVKCVGDDYWVMLDDGRDKTWDHDDVMGDAIPHLIASPAAWTGEGLPPVGVECEAHAGDITSMPSGEREVIWSRAKVIAHDEGFVVFRWLGGEMKGQYAFYRDAESFRPLKTPEQLAVEQRERAIAATAKELHESRGELSPLEHSTIVAAWLYDHGYRKHDK